MIKKVIFISQNEACKLTGWTTYGIISITCSGAQQAPLGTAWGSILRLEFDDIDTQKTSSEGKHYQLFEGDDAGKILNWLKENETTIEVVVVHCAAGISRSAAVAKFIAELYRIKHFNHQYTLYNKHVYRVLRNEYYGKDYE